MPQAIAQALLSVSDKTGIVELARGLDARGVALLSTGGTAKTLAAAGIPVVEIGAYTGFPEMLDGRVKTLHPRVHAGILARRDVAAHRDALAAAGIPGIDLVVVNLYPFRETVADPACTLDAAIENIDIGGPTLVRAAAKNWAHVGVVVDPADYDGVIADLDAHAGTLSEALRFRLMQRAFTHTAAYDGAIANWVTARASDGSVRGMPQSFHLAGELVQEMRYGENPHQQAALYREAGAAASAIASAHQLQGKELSYNNVADADAAWQCVTRFDEAACVIVKHANPCGVACAETTVEAYRRAFATDPTSAFGGIIAFNRGVDAATVEAVAGQFAEVLIAPGFTREALALAASKKNLRVLELALPAKAGAAAPSPDLKRIGGGFLVQSADTREVGAADLTVVTKKAPGADELADLVFAWRVAWFVKSNAIVFGRGGRTLGIGAGQMSRVDSTRIAAIKAGHAGLSLAGSVVASDAFFPFRDGLDVVAEQGATAVIQPGGSVRDDEVIAAADERGIAMVFTGVRHFRH
jgi:phosphoribosylaminoimidazolecarboxamide formyltransferase/IMP cyclohydrolase